MRKKKKSRRARWEDFYWGTQREPLPGGERNSPVCLASPADLLRRASRVSSPREGTRDARLRRSAGEATVCQDSLFFNAPLNGILSCNIWDDSGKERVIQTVMVLTLQK